MSAWGGNGSADRRVGVGRGVSAGRREGTCRRVGVSAGRRSPLIPVSLFPRVSRAHFLLRSLNHGRDAHVTITVPRLTSHLSPLTSYRSAFGARRGTSINREHAHKNAEMRDKELRGVEPCDAFGAAALSYWLQLSSVRTFCGRAAADAPECIYLRRRCTGRRHRTW